MYILCLSRYAHEMTSISKAAAFRCFQINKYILLIKNTQFFVFVQYFFKSRRSLVVKALDSHARGRGFKSCLAQDKDYLAIYLAYWWGKVTGAHLHKCAHSPGHCPLWLGNRLRSKSSMPHKKNSIFNRLHYFIKWERERASLNRRILKIELLIFNEVLPAKPHLKGVIILVFPNA